MTGDRPARVLLAEDERHLGVLLQQFLTGRGHAVTLVHDGTDALAALADGAFDVALLDVQMPGLDGIEVLRAARARPLPPQVIVMTGNSAVDTALAAIRHGAYDFVTKPYRMAEVDLLVRRAVERGALERQVAAADVPSVEALVTEYAPLRAVLALVDRTAPSLGGMVVSGEPGTGRTLLARRVHAAAGGGPFVVVDSAMRNDAALQRRLAASAGGTVYVRRAEWSDAELRDGLAAAAVSARVIVSTARPLGTFDVAAALGRPAADVVTQLRVELPPLRDRGSDVALLAERFVRRFGGAQAPALTAAAVERLSAYRWPGNVTELQVVMESAVARSAGVIEPAHLLLESTQTHSP